MIISGCSGVQEVQKKRDARELYDSAVAAYIDERYEEAQRVFKTLMEDYPLDGYSLEAQLMLGDVSYAMESFEDASSYYTNFVALHPNNPKAPYALFQKGMSHFKDVLSLDRDQTATRKALFAFEDLIRTYPDSPYAPKSKEMMVFLKDRLAEKEFYIAEFYFKGKNYKGALGRLRDILKDYPEASISDKTLFYIGEAYMRLGEKKLADEAYSALLSNFPGSRFVNGAKSRLKES